jgi:hypothetical protein
MGKTVEWMAIQELTYHFYLAKFEKQQDLVADINTTAGLKT